MLDRFSAIPDVGVVQACGWNRSGLQAPGNIRVDEGSLQAKTMPTTRGSTRAAGMSRRQHARRRECGGTRDRGTR